MKQTNTVGQRLWARLQDWSTRSFVRMSARTRELRRSEDGLNIIEVLILIAVAIIFIVIIKKWGDNIVAFIEQKIRELFG